MADIEKHEDEGAKAFDKHLARRLLRYLKPYRARAAASVALVILSSLLEIAGPAIIAFGVDLYVKPLSGTNTVGISQRLGEWLAAHGWTFAPLTGINIVYAVHPYVAPSAMGPLFDSFLAYYGNGAPVMATEYGAPNAYPDQPQEYQAMIDAAEARGLGWCAFAFGPPDPVYNPGAYSLVADANYNPTAAGLVVKNGLAANP